MHDNGLERRKRVLPLAYALQSTPEIEMRLRQLRTQPEGRPDVRQRFLERALAEQRQAEVVAHLGRIRFEEGRASARIEPLVEQTPAPQDLAAIGMERRAMRGEAQRLIDVFDRLERVAGFGEHQTE